MDPTPHCSMVSLTQILTVLPLPAWDPLHCLPITSTLITQLEGLLFWPLSQLEADLALSKNMA